MAASRAFSCYLFISLEKEIAVYLLSCFGEERTSAFQVQTRHNKHRSRLGWFTVPTTQKGRKVTSLDARSSRGRCTQHVRRIRGCDVNPANLPMRGRARFAPGHLFSVVTVHCGMLLLVPSVHLGETRPPLHIDECWSQLREYFKVQLY
jgi:hypothetical protein